MQVDDDDIVELSGVQFSEKLSKSMGTVPELSATSQHITVNFKQNTLRDNGTTVAAAAAAAATASVIDLSAVDVDMGTVGAAAPLITPKTSDCIGPIR